MKMGYAANAKSDMTENTMYNSLSAERSRRLLKAVKIDEPTVLSKYDASNLVLRGASTLKTFVPCCGDVTALGNPKDSKDHMGNEEFGYGGL